MIERDGCSAAVINKSSSRCPHRLMAEQRLEASGYLALRRIQCDCLGGVLCLRGCVPSHYLKQVAQEIAVGVEGVRRVDNQLRVLPAVAAANP
jgi:osmotically-inducible protein OsmY